ncbi:hypothetical protein J2X65_003419, partial [Ancylobacter sp. 3268]|nr:hypothetical protein [Ancylobacter sp. 3268]
MATPTTAQVMNLWRTVNWMTARDQREVDHPEDVAGIFAGGGGGEADRHQADDGHQRAR